MQHKHALWLCIGLLASPIASAHETLDAGWCLDPHSSPELVSTFQFSDQDLDAYSKLPRPGESCGVVDNWYWANRMAHEFCEVTVPNEVAMPFVAAPMQFNDTRNHHTLYKFRDGLNGSCVVCRVTPH